MAETESNTAQDDKHVVDALIEDRAPKLIRTPFWSTIKTIGYPVLGYRKAVNMVDSILPIGGVECFDWMSDYLRLQVNAGGVDHVPESGACIIVANHPGGIADGIALWDALKQKRPDTVFFANNDGLKVCPGLSETIIPVAWRERDRTRSQTRDTLKAAFAAFKAGKCVVIFPAGRMAEWHWASWRLREKPWQTSAISLARKFDLPVIPLAIQQRMPFLYYALAQISEELKDMTVFQGLIGKKQARYTLNFGKPTTVKEMGSTDDEATEMLREVCERGPG
ncbi:MAG: 1-acyl-sn-glycerol-3-phosphate acyltransferase [Maricaulis sp.]|jgi:putative hemolysin|nr:1-acyl-sn-glycerol-3-phosphate acyltransferase [Maricaulis sp.]MDG2043817.1 1-acyl-sn-glycerol-3-phosphate acyltransferase [Maricaulis sp.]